jgi:hypothetical protein
MGVPVRRTSNVFREYFAPFWPSRYATLGDERRRAQAVATMAPVSANGAHAAGLGLSTRTRKE